MMARGEQEHRVFDEMWRWISFLLIWRIEDRLRFAHRRSPSGSCVQLRAVGSFVSVNRAKCHSASLRPLCCLSRLDSNTCPWQRHRSCQMFPDGSVAYGQFRSNSRLFGDFGSWRGFILVLRDSHRPCFSLSSQAILPTKAHPDMIPAVVLAMPSRLIHG